MRIRWVVTSGVAALGLVARLAALPAASDSTPAAGESWEVTSQMSMEGMSFQMPAQTRRVCSKRDQAPENPDPNCRNTELSRTGNKVTWRVECTGPNAMSGRGEMVYSSADAYTGSIRFESAEGVMTLNLSGKRLGTCRAAR